MESGIGPVGLILGLMVIGFYIWLIVTTHSMAIKRHRTGWFWVCIALFCSALLAIFVLWLIGDAEKEGSIK